MWGKVTKTCNYQQKTYSIEVEFTTKKSRLLFNNFLLQDGFLKKSDCSMESSSPVQ